MIAGSFIATLVLRWIDGRSVLTGRSGCDHCGQRLGAMQLIPLVSYAAQHGRCHACGQPIDPFHPLTELAAGAIGAAAFGLAPNPLAGAALALLGWQLLTLALLDARAFWLPHRLSGLLILSGLLLGGLATGATVAERAIGAFAGFAALWLIATLYRLVRRREGMGGGDAPMFAGIGAWLGWTALPPILLLAAVAGVGVAIARMVAQREPWRGDARLPFGTLLALASGAWLLLIHFA